MYICACRQKNTAVCSSKSPRNGSLPLAFAIHILRKMPRKSESLLSSEIAGQPRRDIEHYGNWVSVHNEPEGAL